MYLRKLDNERNGPLRHYGHGRNYQRFLASLEVLDGSRLIVLQARFKLIVYRSRAFFDALVNQLANNRYLTSRVGGSLSSLLKIGHRPRLLTDTSHRQ